MAGKQADGTAKTSEAKTIVCFTADSRDPKAGRPSGLSESFGTLFVGRRSADPGWPSI